ncbi:MAG: hypothetical protein LBD53_05615 [Tannerella sp.]|jgi:hypothetical protein|nr:hypothetical protein [Tannerella sp.]
MNQQNSEINFSEKQRFTPWLLILCGLFITGTTILVSKGDIRITLPALITVGVMTLLYFVCVMQTVIDDKGLYVKMLPFKRKYKFFAWSDIEQAYIILTDKSLSTLFRANIGLRLVLKDGRKVIIGTRRPEEIDEILNDLIDKDILKPNIIHNA